MQLLPAISVILLVFTFEIANAGQPRPLVFWTMVYDAVWYPGSTVTLDQNSVQKMMEGFQDREQVENKKTLGETVSVEAAVGAFTASKAKTCNSFRHFWSKEATSQTQEENTLTNKLTKSRFTVQEGEVGGILVEMNLFVVKDHYGVKHSVALPDSRMGTFKGRLTKAMIGDLLLDSNCEIIAQRLGINYYTRNELENMINDENIPTLDSSVGRAVDCSRLNDENIPQIKVEIFPDPKKTYLIMLESDKNKILSKYWGKNFVSCRGLDHTKVIKYRKYWLWRLGRKANDPSQFLIFNNAWKNYRLADNAKNGMIAWSGNGFWDQYVRIENLGNKRVKIQNVATGRYLGASPKGCGFVDSYGERVWKLVEVTPRDIELCNFSDLENFLQSFYRSVRDYCSQKFSDVPFLNMHRPMVPFRR